jgi:hypothetical protein
MKRDKENKVVPSLWQRFESWKLARAIKKGKVPRGRVVSADAIKSISPSCEGTFPVIRGFLSAIHIKANGEKADLGLVSAKKITTAFRDYIVDSLQNSTTHPMDVFKYHASGTGTTAEANTQTALVTEVQSRTSGTQVEGATADIFKTVGTIDYTGTHAITEHGIFSANAAGIMMDRSLFSAINVSDGDSIQFTYEATFNAEA